MVKNDLIGEMPETPGEAQANWQTFRRTIHERFEKATSAEQRVALLTLNHTIMNMVDKVTDPSVLENFREVRGHSYAMLIVTECLVGDTISAKTAGIVTRREVAAGRMAAEHSLRKLEEMEKFATHVTQSRRLTKKYAPRPLGLAGRAMSWLFQ